MVKIAFFKEELDIPEGVEVIVTENHHVTIKGPNGDITKDFSHARGISIAFEGKKIIISTSFPKSGTLALANTILNILKNLIIGVQINYHYFCKVCYSHFPFNV
jgi:large subunit ribosomal protein L6